MWTAWSSRSRWTASSENHYLEAIRQLREKYGEKIHLTGGLSNVSFGLPCRRLINEVFINLSVEAGRRQRHRGPGRQRPEPGVRSRQKFPALSNGPRTCCWDTTATARTSSAPTARASWSPSPLDRKHMAKYQVLYWKHIPAQVKVFAEGTRPLARPMPERFQEEIDRIAMREGLAGTDGLFESVAMDSETGAAGHRRRGGRGPDPRTRAASGVH